jgi:hypothetical protein
MSPSSLVFGINSTYDEGTDNLESMIHCIKRKNLEGGNRVTESEAVRGGQLGQGDGL